MRRFFYLSALGFALAFLSPGQMNRAFAEEIFRASCRNRA